MPATTDADPARDTCTRCHRRSGELVDQFVARIDGRPLVLRDFLCAWCRGYLNRCAHLLAGSPADNHLRALAAAYQHRTPIPPRPDAELIAEFEARANAPGPRSAPTRNTGTR